MPRWSNHGLLKCVANMSILGKQNFLVNVLGFNFTFLCQLLEQSEHTQFAGYGGLGSYLPASEVLPTIVRPAFDMHSSAGRSQF